MKRVDENISNATYVRAKKRVEQLKKFYRALAIYIVVNIIISGFKIADYMEDGDTFYEALFNIDTYIVWIIWGIFIVLSALKTFKTNAFLGSDWEDRKIKEYMNEK